MNETKVLDTEAIVTDQACVDGTVTLKDPTDEFVFDIFRDTSVNEKFLISKETVFEKFLNSKGDSCPIEIY